MNHSPYYCTDSTKLTCHQRRISAREVSDRAQRYPTGCRVKYYNRPNNNNDNVVERPLLSSSSGCAALSNPSSWRNVLCPSFIFPFRVSSFLHLAARKTDKLLRTNQSSLLHPHPWEVASTIHPFRLLRVRSLPPLPPPHDARLPPAICRLPKPAATRMRKARRAPHAHAVS
jgi:hypothetical protein